MPKEEESPGKENHHKGAQGKKSKKDICLDEGIGKGVKKPIGKAVCEAKKRAREAAKRKERKKMSRGG